MMDKYVAINKILLFSTQAVYNLAGKNIVLWLRVNP